MKNYKDIDEYIKLAPKENQDTLKRIREVVNESAPNAEEAIKYGMPTLRIKNKNLIHFAVFKNHYGFYPAPSAIVEFKKDLEGYVTSKGAIQFPIDKPVPFELIKKIVEFRVKNI